MEVEEPEQAPVTIVTKEEAAWPNIEALDASNDYIDTFSHCKHMQILLCLACETNVFSRCIFFFSFLTSECRK